jgi:hypothetical protein
MNIISTVIRKTDRASEEERKDIQIRSRREIDEFNQESLGVTLISIGSGYAPEDIVEAGVDVTSSYIASPPGQKKGGLMSAIINHPWASAIVTGVIVAGIVKALGWV